MRRLTALLMILGVVILVAGCEIKAKDDRKTIKRNPIRPPYHQIAMTYYRHIKLV